MNKKGFTLIELLAVIVILAIIALIATPIVLNIINDARDSAKERSAELVLSGAQNALTSYMMANNGNEPDAASDFMTNDYFTVSNVTLGSCSADSCTVTTGEDVELTVKYTYSTTKKEIEVTGEGAEDLKVTLTSAAE